MTSEMPTDSRPSYAAISTGQGVMVHGIRSNSDVRALSIPSVWSLARAAGLVSAASAYSWWSELFNRVPFVRARDAFLQDGDGAIQHGFFTPRDSESDATIFAQALRLWRDFRPDLLLIHPCSIDFAGDFWGAASPVYEDNVSAVDRQLDPLLDTLWNERTDAIVLITSDHGMADAGGHGWDAPELREVFFFALGDGVLTATATAATATATATATSLDLAPTILHLLGLGARLELPGNVLISGSPLSKLT